MQQVTSPLESLKGLTRLWSHEATRVFSDRLVDDHDKRKFCSLLQQAIECHIKTNLDEIFTFAKHKVRLVTVFLAVKRFNGNKNTITLCANAHVAISDRLNPTVQEILRIAKARYICNDDEQTTNLSYYFCCVGWHKYSSRPIVL